MRDSALIYRSFYDAIKELQPVDQAALWNAIIEYALDKKEPVLTGICKTVFTLIKPQLDANLRRFENGKQPKNKQNGSKTEANDKQIESKTEANNNNNNNNNYNNNDNLNNNNNVNIPFGDFWELYDKRKGDKRKLESKWNKLKDHEREAIIQYIPKYKDATPDKTYRKDPSTFLNNRAWEDEIIVKGQIKQETIKREIRQSDCWTYEDYLKKCKEAGINPEPPIKW